MNIETATAAAFAAAAPFAQHNGLRPRAMALAIVCGVILSIDNHDGNVAAFSPPYRVSPLIAASSSAMRTRLAYKHLDGQAEYGAKNETVLDSTGEMSMSEYDEKRDVNVKVDVDISVEINRDAIYNSDLDDAVIASSTNSYNASFTIGSQSSSSGAGGGDNNNEGEDAVYYNDLDDPLSVSSSSFNASFTSSSQSSSSSDSSVINNEGEGLIQELETTIQQKNIHLDDNDNPPLKAPKTTPKNKKAAIEPSKTKPSKKFISPIQLIKKVPKVKPIHMTTVFFLKLIGDPMWPTQPPSASPARKNKTETKKKPVIENWKTKMENRKKSTVFMATDYLESLSVGAHADTKNDDSTNDGSKDKDDLHKSLRDQQGQRRTEQQLSQRQAMYDAMRRTNPKEAIDKRTEEGEKQRKKKEREKLERLHVELNESLDAKKRNDQRYLQERERYLLETEWQKELLEGKARERSEAAAEEEISEHRKKAPLKLTSRNGKRGIPILDRPFINAPPLIIGSTLTIPYSTLTPFQKRAVEVAREYNEEYYEQMKIEEEGSEFVDPLSKAGEEGGIDAAPIIAVIDGYTAAATAESLSTSLTASNKRYATLASIEIVENRSDEEEPFSIKLMGVGRVFLHDYFSSKDAGMTQEDEELSKLLARIQAFDREEQLDEEDEDHSVEHASEDYNEEDEELPVVMAEFDLLLDDSSILSDQSTKYGEDATEHRASSMHAITELYRCANRVYRLHEERKKLVTGLRAGVARLRLGKGKAAVAGGDENCLAEFEDCDGLGLIGWVLDETNDLEEETPTPSENDTPRSHLETLQNYGLGTYGILSTIPDLTKQLMSYIEPYYSPVHRNRDEYKAEVASFVVFRSLEAYATPAEVAEALVVPSSATQRLELAYEIMMRHREELMELVERVSWELMECGEECTDLW